MGLEPTVPLSQPNAHIPLSSLLSESGEVGLPGLKGKLKASLLLDKGPHSPSDYEAKAVPILRDTVLLVSTVGAHPNEMDLDSEWMDISLKPSIISRCGRVSDTTNTKSLTANFHTASC